MELFTLPVANALHDQQRELEIPEAPTCTEIAEAVHALRNREGRWKSAGARASRIQTALQDLQNASHLYPDHPEVARLLAHAMIELLDFAQASGIDIEEEILRQHQSALTEFTSRRNLRGYRLTQSVRRCK